MEIDVVRIMKLAKLDFSDEERKKMEEHFRKMLKLVEKLNEVDVENVKPLYYPHEDVEIPRRLDETRTGLEKCEVLENAPDTFTDYIKAPSPLKGIKKK